MIVISTLYSHSRPLSFDKIEALEFLKPDLWFLRSDISNAGDSSEHRSTRTPVEALTLIKGIHPDLMRKRFAIMSDVSKTECVRHLRHMPETTPLFLLAIQKKPVRIFCDLYLPPSHFEETLVKLADNGEGAALSVSVPHVDFSSVLPRQRGRKNASPSLDSAFFQIQHRFICHSIPDLAMSIFGAQAAMQLPALNHVLQHSH